MLNPSSTHAVSSFRLDSLEHLNVESAASDLGLVRVLNTSRDLESMGGTGAG